MNRAERRRMMHKLPRYRTALKQASREAVKDLEKMFQEKWKNQEEDKENGTIKD